MEGAKTTLSRVVDAAAAECKGKIVSVMAAMADDGKMSYQAACVAEGKMMVVEMDASGKGGATKKMKSVNGMDAAASEKCAKAMEADKMPLTKMIEAAETASKGKAVAALAMMKKDKLAAEVYTVAGEKLMKADVDNTGKADKMEEAKALPDMKTEVMPPAKGG
ncbi:MAG: hypothetical protein HYR83_15005 [Planctomycetes bacterium]|nr:hypothetical protein [Planctomycetota bacterium]